MYSKSAFDKLLFVAYLDTFNLARFMKGPSGPTDNMDAVPRRTNLPEDEVMGRAVFAVLGARRANSIVSGRPWVPGLMTPVIGLPDWETGRMAWLVAGVFSAAAVFNEVPGLAT